MRVIAGAARRTALVAPLGSSTRPTADRAKEGLFNIISERVRGARFLDIFCGSGAIGIEALSRGAKEAVFVENAAPALKAVKENLAKTKLQNAEIIEASAENAISRLQTANRRFDIIFLDPPYDSLLLEQTLQKVPPLLAEGGIVIAETEQNRGFAPQSASLFLTSTRVYGRTVFLFLQAEEAE
ncbi:MAG: 16S rRNA (guanine(966)-N(2))-methyltransferase RsmD [Defluviitaleaceae bacterium]|nr:16S rRNA (guanine(966)-N(2))-methyltransferase RsmD [Defluviitaleaceae bacterium]MCL2262344.1 16S rRNA (guanine(966)-N(2))-methyltransferase RsmD [Defluviitaleaceae bacterium]